MLMSTQNDADIESTVNYVFQLAGKSVDKKNLDILASAASASSSDMSPNARNNVSAQPLSACDKNVNSGKEPLQVDQTSEATDEGRSIKNCEHIVKGNAMPAAGRETIDLTGDEDAATPSDSMNMSVNTPQQDTDYPYVLEQRMSAKVGFDQNKKLILHEIWTSRESVTFTDFQAISTRLQTSDFESNVQ